jgi:putative tryptophan/tyrosine transport system substrate-binding protein
MSRNVLCLTLCAMLAALSASANAQQSSKLPRIGMLGSTSPSLLAARYEAFRLGLRELGHLEGKNIAIEYRYAEGKVDRFPALAAELLRSKVDIIVAGGDPGARAAKNATKTIPVLMVGVGTDPVETGLVESLGHPGGNITGFTNFGVELGGKRLELFKEAVPKIVRVAFLYDPNNRANKLYLKELQTVAQPLGVTIQLREIPGAGDFDKVFLALTTQPPDGLVVSASTLMNANDKRIINFAVDRRLPSLYARRESVEAGGLMSYDPDSLDQYRRAAVYVDKLLKGAKPADLPVQRPAAFELVINLKTAKQIGVTISPQVLARANRVIR